MFARTVARLSHGGSKTTFVTSAGNPGHQYPVLAAAGAGVGIAVWYKFSSFCAEAERLKKKHAAAHHDNHH